MKNDIRFIADGISACHDGIFNELIKFLHMKSQWKLPELKADNRNMIKRVICWLHLVLPQLLNLLGKSRITNIGLHRLTR